MTGGGLIQGSRWEFHNATTGEVREYVLDELPDPKDITGTTVIFPLNPQTGKRAAISVNWLLGVHKYPSRWKPVA